MTIAPRVFNSFVFDEHDTDHLTSLALSTFWNRALAACLLELIDQLKAKGIYQDTIINIAGEFGRNPRNNGTGSDHSPEATSNTFLGGALAGNQFIGNTLKNSTHATYSGTWGYYASNPALSTGGAPVGYLNLGHLAASIATMLRAPSPVTASTTLLKETNGVISSLLPGSKLV